jgi:hypothetical protein
MLVENKEGFTMDLGHEGIDNKLTFNNILIAPMIRTDCPKCYTSA